MKLSLAILLLITEETSAKRLRNYKQLGDYQDFQGENDRLLMIDQAQSQKKWDLQVLSVMDADAYVSEVKNTLQTQYSHGFEPKKLTEEDSDLVSSQSIAQKLAQSQAHQQAKKQTAALLQAKPIAMKISEVTQIQPALSFVQTETSAKVKAPRYNPTDLEVYSGYGVLQQQKVDSQFDLMSHDMNKQRQHTETEDGQVRRGSLISIEQAKAAQIEEDIIQEAEYRKKFQEQELVTAALKSMSESQIQQKEFEMKREVDAFSKTLEFTHFDKAKDILSQLRIAEVQTDLPKVNTLEQLIAKQQFTFDDLAENEEVQKALGTLEIDQGNLNMNPTSSAFIVKFSESAENARKNLSALKYWTDPRDGKAFREQEMIGLYSK